MSYKLLEEQDLNLMLNFVDDENTLYNKIDLKKFIDNNNSFGFIVLADNKIIGFASAYLLLKPDGRKVMYLDAIDIMQEYQGQGYGTGLISFVCDYAKNLGCYEMFLITNKSNTSACKCYEASGGKSDNDDDIVYVYDLMENK